MSLVRKVAVVGSATLASRVLAFGRDVGVAAVLGAGPLADAYFAALQIPNLFRRLLAEGALNAAFVPRWMRLHDADGVGAARRFGEEAAGFVFAIASALALACAVLAPLLVQALAPGFEPDGRLAHAVVYLRLSAPYLALAGLVSVAAAVLTAQGRVAAASFGLVLFNAVMVAAVGVLWALGESESPAAGMLLSLSVVLAGLGQLVFVGGALLRSPARPRRLAIASSRELRGFLAQALPGLIAAGMPQLTLIAGAMIASASPAAVAWLYYANRLYELPLGVLSVALATVFLPRLSQSVRADERAALADAQSRGYEIALGLALPSAAALALIAEPIVATLFERAAFGARDTQMVAAALAAIACALPGHALEKSFAAVSYAHADTRAPMRAALCGLGAASAGGLLLFPHFGHVGVAAAIAVAAWVCAALLGITLMRRGWLMLDDGAQRRLPRIALAALAMGVAVVLSKGVLAPAAGEAWLLRLLRLVSLVSVGLGVYLAALRVLGVVRLGEVLRALRGRAGES